MLSVACAVARRRDLTTTRTLLARGASRPRTFSIVSGHAAPISAFEALAFATGCLVRHAERAVSSVCGVTVGVGLACLTASCLDSCERQQLQEARVARQTAKGLPARADATSPQVLDLLANRLVRKNSRVINEAYTFQGGPPLGEGSFGVVLKAVHNRTGIERAVKRINKAGVCDVPSLEREVESLRVMDHPHVCRMVEYFETPQYLWLVTELCRGEELCNRLLDRPGGMAEADAGRLLRQMFRAAQHCHRHSVVHRDLKPENFLITQGKCGDVVKLIDFGSSIPSGTQGGPTGVPPEAGTLLYMSPQMLRGEPASSADDAWSLGVTFYILLTGRFPFSTNDDARFQELADTGLLQEDIQQHLQSMQNSPAACDLAARLLAFDPSTRISVEAALRHPFIAGLEEPTATPEHLDTEQLRALHEAFSRSSRLRRLALAAFARLGEASWEDADRVRTTFLALDAGDGTVSTTPTTRLARWLQNPSTTPGSKEGRLSYTSFAAAAFDGTSIAGHDRLCQAVFELLDADRDGQVSSEDLRRRLGVSLQEACEMLSEALPTARSESHPSKSMSFSDFIQLMRPLEDVRQHQGYLSVS